MGQKSERVWETRHLHPWYFTLVLELTLAQSHILGEEFSTCTYHNPAFFLGFVMPAGAHCWMGG